MRIVTWNCNMVFRDKFDLLLNLMNPDIMLIQECEKPERLTQLTDSYNSIWVGDNKNKGLATFIKKQYEFEEMKLHTERVRHVLGIKVGGIKIINFWAMNDREDVQNRYVAQVWRGLRLNQEVLGDNTIVAGDFNWNVIWDNKKSKYPLHGYLSDVVDYCNNRNIKSAYHFINNEKFGKELQSTFFMYRNENKKYHTDYIFASAGILAHKQEFKIGHYDDWRALSDHIPILLDF
ncbi:endonuclease/exonuclease/phosphatase family protein [Methanomassiliicoccus luminyensis]|uniref:endonuclease/exonuclease/phosphatase family protein n=1 Tax=Methanomassiliicoccus luminyensis TaxID=1080712 RepID=UPI000474E011|nr:endonuclease/exonuclease/phosphatase family protein [Methanomassiliicoccus luminyensis]